MPRKKLAAIVTVLAATVLVAVTATGALATLTGGADSDSSGAAPGPKAATTTSCTVHEKTHFKSDNAPDTTSPSTYTVPGGFPADGFILAANVFVPTGQERCALVEFSAESTCQGDGAGPDNCFARAASSKSSTNTIPMNPNDSSRAFDSESSTFRAHSLQWWLRLTGGSQNIIVQVRDDGGLTNLSLDDWMVTVTIYAP